MHAEQPPPPPPLDYRTPQAVATRELFSVAGFIGGLIPTLALAIMLLLVIPRFEQVFRDFGTKLPPPTVVLLVISRIARAAGWWLLPILSILPVTSGLLIALVGSAPNQTIGAAAAGARKRRSIAIRLTILSLLLIAVVLALCLGAPMISLIRAVRGSGRH